MRRWANAGASGVGPQMARLGRCLVDRLNVMPQERVAHILGRAGVVIAAVGYDPSPKIPVSGPVPSTGVLACAWRYDARDGGNATVTTKEMPP
jgi:hypothetical protein